MDIILSALDCCSAVSVSIVGANSVSAMDLCHAISRIRVRTQKHERIVQEHKDFVINFKEMQAVFELLPRRLLSDHKNPLDYDQLRVMFGMGKVPVTTGIKS
jgi:hypothetical protein